MKTLFQYNWMIREDWYKWCEEVPEEELLRDRTGGVGSILHTLFHIVDVEWSWIRVLQGKSEFTDSFEGYRSLDKVKALDASFRPEVRGFVNAWNCDLENKQISPDEWGKTFRWGEVMRHMIAHEIHHIGQLSVWSREIGKAPISANLIDRGL